ncbi:hypothetical protein EC973_000775 [Apophysomyces ossiformis]|uniref:Phospholipid/glycerol acyltransferase domain-containing protein n=1 Tax=Apophysomyces ossiformis TaxID=679940 RepID=A0A8H7ENM8_9FUNG|nr:hypothetical protein EC973_000775 [Apophysomyces ossiformis]
MYSRGANNITNKDSTSVQAGDIIVANWTSYVDILYLAYRFRPVFTQVYPGTKQLRPIGTWEAIRLCTRVPSLAPESGVQGQLYSMKELANLAKSSYHRPMVVLPEGTTSNGRALLQFAPLFKEYEYDNLPPTYTVGNQLFHFIKLCSQFHNTLTVKYLAPGEAPCSSSSSLTQTADLSSLTESQDSVGDQLSLSLSHVARLRRIKLSMADKRDFLQYYNSRSDGERAKRN